MSRVLALSRSLLRAAPAARPLPRAQLALRLAAPALRCPAFAAPVRTFASEPFLDPKEVAERVIAVVKNFEKVDASKVGPNARFKEDLDLDSLDAVEVVMAIEEEFAIEIPDAEADKILSVADAVKYISAHPMAK